VITQPRPARGTRINGLPPLSISAYLWDAGTGINPSTIRLMLDGKPMAPSDIRYDERRAKSGVVYDPVQRRVDYHSRQTTAGQRAEALPNGRHTVRVEATDWKGNANVMEWSFVVDNTLPVRPRVQPGQPGTPGAPGGYGAPGTPGAPGGYGNPGAGGARPRPQPRRRPVRGGGRQPGALGTPGYGGGS
jgi:lactocepin